MHKRTILAGLVAAAVFAAGVAVYAQPYGYGPGWMMGGGYGPGWMMEGGYGPGMMGGGPRWGGYGPRWMHTWARAYGPESGTLRRDLNLTAEDVKVYLERTMQNPRLKVGDVKQSDDNTITADIVTKDKDGLVQRFTIDRHTGFWRPAE
jgi:hypothetical protein